MYEVASAVVIFLLGFSAWLATTSKGRVTNSSEFTDDVRQQRTEEPSQTIVRALAFSLDGGALGNCNWRLACALLMPEETRLTWERLDGSSEVVKSLRIERGDLDQKIADAHKLAVRILSRRDLLRDIGCNSADRHALEHFRALRNILGLDIMERYNGKTPSLPTNVCIPTQDINKRKY